MPRKPMDPISAAQHAQRQLEYGRKFFSRDTVRSDFEAFQRLKQSGKVEEFDSELRRLLDL